MDFDSIASGLAEVSPIIPQRIASVPGRVLHIDGDILAYQCSGGDDTDVGTARNILRHTINKLADASGAEKVILHLTASGSTKGDRHLIAQTKVYQGQRKGARPKNWQYLRDYMMDGAAGYIKNWADREADDGFGFVSANMQGSIIASRDKDMRMLPGLHLVWDTLAIVNVPIDAYAVEEEAKLYGPAFFWHQMLMGDTADNIPGLPRHPAYPRGVGEVAARKILARADSTESAFRAVLTAYKEEWKGEYADRFVEQAALLWIRRTRAAPILEFMDYLPESACETTDEDALIEAGERLLAHVNKLKEEANAYQTPLS